MIPNSAELSPDIIVAHMQDIALENKESKGDIDSIKDKYYDYISDQEKSDPVGTDDIDYAVENEIYF